MDHYEQSEKNRSHSSPAAGEADEDGAGTRPARGDGEQGAEWTADWFPRLYEELRALAHAQRQRYRNPDGPGTTSIVHEAYERLNKARGDAPEHTLHFYRTAARAMRSVLIDNARRSRAVRHGGHLRRAAPEALELVSSQRSEELLALDEALDRLADADPALAELVHLRIFGGLTVEELSELLAISASTIRRRWLLACALLHERLAEDD